MVSPLSVQLREGTKEAHRAAEKSPFMQVFFAGQLSVEDYRAFLVQLFHLYTALEEQQERHQAHKVYGKIFSPILYRRKALVQDLNFYFDGSDWIKTHPQQATTDYIERIRSLAEGWTVGLVAHHYTRYMGDLSGGQVLKRIVAKTYQLTTSEGLAFYTFSQITDHAQFKDAYREQLDSMPIDPAAAQKIVDEANVAFALNQALSDAMLISQPAHPVIPAAFHIPGVE